MPSSHPLLCPLKRLVNSPCCCPLNTFHCRLMCYVVCLNGTSSRARPHSMESFHVSCPHFIDRYPEFHHQTSLNVIHEARPFVFAVSLDWPAAAVAYDSAAGASADDSSAPSRSSSSAAYYNYCRSSEVHEAAALKRRPTSNVWVRAVFAAASRQIQAVAFDACYDDGRELLLDRFSREW